MKSLTVVMACSLLLSCSNPPAGPHQPLDGVWQLAARSNPLEPTPLRLTQRDSVVTGTGTGMGVDVPISIEVTGSADLPTVTLTFWYPYLGSGNDSASFTGTLQSDGRLVGQVVFGPPFLSQTDTLIYSKQ